MAMTRKGYLYQYDGVDWIELDPKMHGDKYMSALPDLLENAPDAEFNNLFCLNLIAQKAFVKYLQALEITLSELTENGKTQRGSIKSQNYKQGASGFKIDYNGDCEFNNGKFRGHVDVDSGELNNVTIKEQAVVLGTISSGPVYISNESTAPVSPRIFGSGTTIDIIRTFLGGNGTFNISGSYGSRTDLISIVTTTVKTVNLIIPPQNIIARDVPVYSLRLIFSSGNDVYLENTNSNSSITSATISQQLSVGGSISGKVFRIIDLPTGGAGLPPGTVYRNGNQLMIAT
jgi:hypothetical protein